MTRQGSKPSRWLLATAAAGAITLAGTAFAPATAESNNNTSAKLRQAVTLEGLTDHLEALQAIADANGGERFAGHAGHDQSAEYAADVFRAAGYNVSVQEFEYLASEIVGPAVLERTAPPPGVSYVEDVDYTYMDQTDPGDVESAVTAVDLALGAGNASTSGCDASDFAGFPAGNIALLQRGACTFEAKVENAAAAGAVGAVIFNQGNTPDRTGLAGVTLGATNMSGIPALFATYDRGVEWAGTSGLRLHLVADTVRETATTRNVIAETKGGDPDNIVMAGAHLDSVIAGPGINDNGSGSAAILEVAEQMQKTQPKNKLRFALWSAEESGLVGSGFYVANLSDEEKQKIALYLNFDMVGSPNYVRFVYDGDNSRYDATTTPPAAVGPGGSGAIEQAFHDYFAGESLPTEETPFSGRSDYGPFITAGIPAGGLFTGAEGVKTAEQAAIFGGTAGVAYDHCYHQACDTIDNVNTTGFHEMADAVAHSILTFAMDTRSVNGEGKGHPVSPPGQHTPGEPVVASPGGSTGGLHEDHAVR